MTIWLALLLGIVQGVCEFLPISSSGHLLMLQTMFGLSEPTASLFTVMLHVATLVAVCVVYRKLLWKLIKHPIQKTVGLLILATIPTVLFALIMKKVSPLDGFYADAELGKYLGVGFILTSVLLVVSDMLLNKLQKRDMKSMKVKDALVVGGMQCLGVFPGVSRSGSTITGALLTGLDRKSAADFSFLMSIPAILGATVLEAADTIKEGITLAGSDIVYIVVGMIAAGVTGYFAIRFMIKLITKRRLWGFAVYTGVLGVFVILSQIFGWAGF
ncbi:MAG: undecaprenyl-diphosphate phosphatase [Eubacteriales bacterium]|nr:undecaprenyl-diphosphate phosphatase [Eubacteriales bacterium]